MATLTDALIKIPDTKRRVNYVTFLREVRLNINYR